MIKLMIIIGSISTLLIFLHVLMRKRKASKLLNENLRGKHVLITGGSSGIGKSVAIMAAAKGANVTIVARDQAKLDSATREIQNAFLDCTTQKVLSLSVDISNSTVAIEKAIERAVNDIGPVYMLVNCAGTSISYRFDDTPIEDFDRMLKLNFMGSVSVTKLVLPHMKEHRQGHIVFVSSMAGLLGLYGYTAYSASKFALVGLAQALCMEVKPYNIKVTVSYPPDTDTPGFKEEEKTKPIETRKISESAGLFDPDIVAKQLLSDSLMGEFCSIVGFEGVLLSTLCCGMSPFSSFLQLIFQISTMGVFRLAGAFYLCTWDKIIRNCAKEKEQQKKAE